MYQQSQIRRHLTSPEGVARLQGLMDAESFKNRSAVGHRVCEEFGFHDACGGAQLVGCMKVLRDLDAAEEIRLPASTRAKRQVKARRLGYAVDAAEGVPGRVDQVSGLKLVVVRDESQLRVWNELVEREHPKGAAVHVGAQLRYLIDSEHGYLGAIGFAASALTLQCRDGWIGWDEEQRCSQLNRVIGLSRFLIRRGVRCANLASRSLGLCLRRLSSDFEHRYGYRPYLVETFVAPSHSGVSLRASNWTHVGETSGRGRRSGNEAYTTVKSVYIYELTRDWRKRLGVLPQRVAPRQTGEGLDIGVWADNEFDGAPLGDLRLSRRLVKSASLQARQPMASFPSAAGAERAAVFGHYRMIDQPADSEVTPRNILAPHRARTLQRMQNQTEVLCVQDGTDLNFADHGECKGLGLISKNKASAGTVGIHMHSMLALDEQGVPLGVPHIEYGSIEDKKMLRWSRGLQQCSAMAAELEGVTLVSVMDREGDCFELFVERRHLGNVELLVRARYNRSLGKGVAKLFDVIRRQSEQGRLEVFVGHRSARRSSRSQKAVSKQDARVAQVSLRWRQVQLPVPSRSELKDQPPMQLSLVHVQEIDAPAGVKSIEWFLLTTLPVNSRREAERVVERYRLRWRIEDWHRILKSGCKVEFLKHQSGDRIERAVTINAVIAWRLAAMTLLGRETPELPMEVMFTDVEIGVLQDFARDNKLAVPGNLGAAVVTVAITAGYLNRKNDPPPGYEKIWEGYIRLVNMSQAYELAIRRSKDGWLYERLSPD